MTIITEYLTLQEQYQAQYGQRTILLLQIGNFYEIYGYDPTHCTNDLAKQDRAGKIWGTKIGYAQECSIILNCVLAYENNSEPYSIRNPHKVGFPCIAYEKNKTTLLANDYVIVRMDQSKSGKTVSRFVAEVCSPSLEIDNIISIKNTNNIIAVYLEYQQCKVNKNSFDQHIITIGVSNLDIITGENKISEFYSKHNDEIIALQDLYRFLIAHYPKEILFHINDLPETINQDSYQHHLEKHLQLSRYDRVVIKINQLSKDYIKIAYQNEILKKIFMKNIEQLGLERVNYGRIAYISLLNHCNAHNPRILNKILLPDLKWLDEDKYLILTHNCALQLNIFPIEKSANKFDSLYSLLDENATNLGKRMLQSLLQNPFVKSEQMEMYYNMVDEMLQTKINEQYLWAHLGALLRDLPDIGRLQTKLAMKIITPKELAVLYRAYINIINLYCVIIGVSVPTIHKNLMYKEMVDNFNLFMSTYTQLINFKNLECCTIISDNGRDWMEFTDFPINTGLDHLLDGRLIALKSVEIEVQKIVDYLNSLLIKTSGQKITFKQGKKTQGAKKNEASETILTVSNAKANLLVQIDYDRKIVGELNIVVYNTNEKIISSEKINKLLQEIDTLKSELRTYLVQWYSQILEQMNQYQFYPYLSKMVGLIDLIHSYAKVSYKYNYYRPQLIESECSSFQLTNLRHPIIERIIDYEYVRNDLSLGGNGILLFGLNQVGKSSLAKAVALNIIMAQIGCFTAGNLTLMPYRKIITRLNGGDNLFLGQSSFATEMAELRTILRQNDQYSLVIGDEIAHTSDSTSGTALTAAAVLSLAETNASFLFASHAHDVLDLPQIKSIKKEKLRICHLSTTKEPKGNSLIYNRKLQEGAGEKVYGILVAETLNLPKDFIATAYQILNYMEGKNQEVIAMKPSKYNKEVYVSECSKCGTIKDLQTHHIKEQHLADEKGMFAGTHKNVKQNLLVLCRECHIKEHQ